MDKAEKRGNLRDAVRFAVKHEGATVPGLAKAFNRSQSTADNWLRTATRRGFLKMTKPESQDKIKGTVGRPACTYVATANGKKWVETPEAKGLPTHVRDKPKAKRKTSGKAKATKTKTSETPKEKRARKAPKTEAASKPDRKARDRRHRLSVKVKAGKASEAERAEFVTLGGVLPAVPASEPTAEAA